MPDNSEEEFVQLLEPQLDDVESISISSIQPIVSEADPQDELLHIQSTDIENLPDSEEPEQPEEDPTLVRYRSACQNGDLATVKELIENKTIDIQNDHDGKEKITGLHWASVNNRLSIVEYLISKGASVNPKAGKLNATPLHWAASYGYVYIVDYLLKNDADPTITDDQGFNLLHLSVNSSNIMLILYVLYNVVDNGIINIDCPDPNGRTPLLWAAYQGDSLTVNALLKFGANHKISDSAGFTPLHWAVVKGQPHVLKYLIKDGADYFLKTNDGKDCFTISQEMNTSYSLKEALNHCGFNTEGYPLIKLFTSLHAKVITFLTPWIILGTVLGIFAYIHPLFALIVTSLMLLAVNKALYKFVLPCYRFHGNQAITLLKSPLLAGIFTGSVFWLTTVWLFNILPATLFDEPLSNITLLLSIALTCFLFGKLIRSDAGFLTLETDHKTIRGTIKDLMLIGKFDTNNFCVETLVRKPLRSRYSYLNQAIITRFDHYCPWVYNDIGLKNHKQFVFFILTMITGIWTFSGLCMKYFDEIEDLYDDATCYFLGDDELCAGFTYSRFVFLTMVWSVFQSIWVVFLVFVQCFQVLKGVTSYEFTKIVNENKIKKNNSSKFYESFSTTPEDHFSRSRSNSNISVTGGSPLDLSNTDPNNMSNHRGSSRRFCSQCFVVLGIDQWIIITKEALGFIPTSRESVTPTSNSSLIRTNYGWKTNSMDFWLTSDLTAPTWQRFFNAPATTKALLNNIEVDYKTLYELPENQFTENPGNIV